MQARHPYHEGCTALYVNNQGMFCSCTCHRSAPTTGAEYFERTGETTSAQIMREADIPDEHGAEVGLLANLITNTSPGYRHSDGVRAAIRTYRNGGIEAVRAARA